MNTVGARKAALAMATMHPTDRRWMLRRMPESWRAMLEPLIRDARRFTTIDADILQEALDGSSTSTRVDVPRPDVLIAVLNGLSGQWAARVLAAAAADHAEIYLAACNRFRADEIRRSMSQLPHPFPPSLASAMARCLDNSGRDLRSVEVVR
ncbi:MAG: hypothetical protein ABI114_01710 [Rhodanobacter sp.]